MRSTKQDSIQPVFPSVETDEHQDYNKGVSCSCIKHVMILKASARSDHNIHIITVTPTKKEAALHRRRE